MKILAAGDWHGNLLHAQSVIQAAQQLGCDRVVQVGDFGYWPHQRDFLNEVEAVAGTYDIDVYWLDGNHENHAALAETVDVTAAEPQRMAGWVWYLPRGCTWVWDGCRFMAFGGATSIDRDLRVEGRDWWRQEQPTAEQVARAGSRGQVDVLFTHDTPQCMWEDIREPWYSEDPLSRDSRQAVQQVMAAADPLLVVHGHYHKRFHRPPTLDRPQVDGLSWDGDRDWRDTWLVFDTEQWRRRP